MTHMRFYENKVYFVSEIRTYVKGPKSDQIYMYIGGEIISVRFILLHYVYAVMFQCLNAHSKYCA